MEKCPKYIVDFMEAVYPGHAELALATFNEKHALVSATECINQLSAKLASAEADRDQQRELADAASRQLRAALDENARLAACGRAVERIKARCQQEMDADVFHAVGGRVLANIIATIIREEAERG